MQNDMEASNGCIYVHVLICRMGSLLEMCQNIKSYKYARVQILYYKYKEFTTTYVKLQRKVKNSEIQIIWDFQ